MRSRKIALTFEQAVAYLPRRVNLNINIRLLLTNTLLGRVAVGF
jgi:hypothetical protein